MNGMIHQPAERESVLVQANREELVERIGRVIREDGTVQPLPGLHLYRYSLPLERVTAWSSRPCAWLPRGARSSCWARAATGTTPSTICWPRSICPASVRSCEASKERPYLSLRLELAPTLVSSVMLEAGHAEPRDPTDVRAIDVSPLDGNLLDACVRLVRLLDSPAEAAGPPAADHAGNYLPTPDGRAGWPAPSPGSSGGLYSLTSPEPSSDSAKTSTSHFASSSSHENWA